ALLLPLYQQRLYGFEVIHGHTWIFPVHFKGEGPMRRVLYEDAVDFAAFGGARMQSDAQFFEGVLWTADFRYGVQTDSQENAQQEPMPRAEYSVLIACYQLLGLEYGVDRHTVRKAYRQLALLYHPDLHP